MIPLGYETIFHGGKTSCKPLQRDANSFPAVENDFPRWKMKSHDFQLFPTVENKTPRSNDPMKMTP
jgi:hypothetical protein